MSFLNPFSWKRVPSHVEVVRKHLVVPVYGSKTIIFDIPAGHPLQRFKLLPPPSEDDLWRLQAYKKLMQDFFKMWEDRNGWFDVCTVGDYIDFYQGDLSRARSSDEYEKLRLIHCVHWNEMHPDIAAEVPTLFNIVLEKAGLIEREINHESETLLIQGSK